MAAWMIYVMAVTLLLGVAALTAEHSARLRRIRTRWYWFSAMLASLLLPAVMASVSIQWPGIAGLPVAEGMVVLRDATSISLPSGGWLSKSAQPAPTVRSLDSVLKMAWWATSLLLVLVLAATSLHLHRRGRRWHAKRLRGIDVQVSGNVGPSVVGFLRPRIVVPAWVAEASPEDQDAVLAHEQSHIRAGDPQLFSIALCLLVFMPWNLPLWWQLRRLRNAVEVDCDARVLAGGQDAMEYSRALIAVGERQSSFPGTVAAMSESPSFLEQRIALMISKPRRFWRFSAATAACTSLALVAVAAQVAPPDTQGPAVVAGPAIELPPQVLDAYVGHYTRNGVAVMTVVRNGSTLRATMNGYPTWDAFAASPTRFVANGGKDVLDFVSDGTGPAIAVVLHGNGRDVTFTRVDDATARQFHAGLDTRIRTSSPAAGTEAAVRNAIAWSVSGHPDYSVMAPELAQSFRKHIAAAQPVFQALGPVQSVNFTGADPKGSDSFLVKFENGNVIFDVLVDARGTLIGLSTRPAP